MVSIVSFFHTLSLSSAPSPLQSDEVKTVYLQVLQAGQGQSEWQVEGNRAAWPAGWRGDSDSWWLLGRMSSDRGCGFRKSTPHPGGEASPEQVSSCPVEDGFIGFSSTWNAEGELLFISSHGGKWILFLEILIFPVFQINGFLFLHRFKWPGNIASRSPSMTLECWEKLIWYQEFKEVGSSL